MILDQDTHTPIRSVSVLVEGTSRRYEVLSDTKGFFQITGLQAGSYTIFVRYIGYKTVSVYGIEANENKTPFIEVFLEKEVKETRKVIPRSEQIYMVPYSDVLYGSGATQSVMYGIPNKSILDKSAATETYDGAYKVDQWGSSYSFNAISPIYNITKLGDALNVRSPFITGLQSESLLGYSDDYVLNSAYHYNSSQAFHSSSTIGATQELEKYPGYFRGNEMGFGVRSDGFQVRGQGGLRPYEQLARSSYKFNLNYFDSNLISQKLFRNSNIPKNIDFNMLVHIPTKKVGRFGIWTKAAFQNQNISAIDSLYIPFGVRPYSDISDEKGAFAMGLDHSLSLFNKKLILEGSVGWKKDYDRGVETNNRISDFSRSYDLSSNQLGWSYRVKYIPSVSHQFQLRVSETYDKMGLYDLTYKENKENRFYDLDTLKVKERTFSLGYTTRYSNAVSSFIGGKYSTNDLLNTNLFSGNIGFKIEFTPHVYLKLGADVGKSLMPWSVYVTKQDIPKDGEEVIPYKSLPQESYISGDVRLDVILPSEIRWTVEGEYKMLDDLWVEASSSSFAMVNWAINPYQSLPNSLSASGSGSILKISSTIKKGWSKGTFFELNGSWYKTSLTTSDQITRKMAWDPSFVVSARIGGRIDLSTRSYFSGGVNTRVLGGRESFAVDINKSKISNRTFYNTTGVYNDKLKTSLLIGVNVGWNYNARKVGHQILFHFENITDGNFFGYKYYSFDQKEVVVPKSVGLYGRVSYIMNIGFERSKKREKKWY
ncbi:carboxypeptidase-like regulatory domain-containing protein [Halosquirtibacter laminarini]|uniref:Carboxypeptidase-like regulatory domain-containing protein n=1 Tax=Halosquirtibacter laminarini TaxID=3374600 RepID=A0AC61NKU1_9BACT|nr:carboxypeptidase-like regulatory domain-containing protein [Prolixibacteraceae bacterium]